MEYPTNKADLICELERFLHAGTLGDDDHAFFDDFLQSQPPKWYEMLDEEAFDAIFNGLSDFLCIAVQLYTTEGYSNLLVNGLSAIQSKHQMRHRDNALNFSNHQAETRNFLEHASKVLEETNDLDQAIPNKKVISFITEVPNRYMLVNLMLCALKEDYQESYQEYVKGKLMRFMFSFAFWRPMGNVFEPNVPLAQLLWLDLLCDLVAPKPSSSYFRQMIEEAED